MTATATATKDAWISVEERLPEEGRCVPVWVVDTDENEDEGLWSEGYLNGDRWEGLGGGPVMGHGTGDRESWQVLYWYDLPSLPLVKWRNGAVVPPPESP